MKTVFGEKANDSNENEKRVLRGQRWREIFYFHTDEKKMLRRWRWLLASLKPLAASKSW